MGTPIYIPHVRERDPILSLLILAISAIGSDSIKLPDLKRVMQHEAPTYAVDALLIDAIEMEFLQTIVDGVVRLGKRGHILLKSIDESHARVDRLYQEREGAYAATRPAAIDRVHRDMRQIMEAINQDLSEVTQTGPSEDPLEFKPSSQDLNIGGA